MNRPTIRQLEYVVALADQRSFHRAAAACFVTQPALSTQIAAIEGQLGMKLFERVRPAVTLTPAGEEIVRRARVVLGEIDALAAAAVSFTKPLSGPLRLGVIPTVAPFVLPRVLPPLRRRYPELRLFLHEERTPDLVEKIRSGRLDVGLLALEADLGDLETLALCRDRFVVAVPAAHALAKRSSVTQRDLRGEEVLLLEDGHCLRDQALEVCRSAGATEVGDFRAASLGTLTEMVANGIGVTLLPRLAVAAPRSLPREVVIRPFRAPEPYRTIGLAWRRTSPRKRDFQLLGDVIRSVVKRNSAD